MPLFDPNRTDYIEQLNNLADAGYAAAARMPRQQYFVVGVDGQVDFELDAVPLNGVCIISIDGYTIHRYTVAGKVVTSSTRALHDEEVMITFWA